MLHFGAFVTESSGESPNTFPTTGSEKNSLARYARDGYDGGSSFYANEWPGWRRGADEQRLAMLEAREPVVWSVAMSMRAGDNRST